MILTIDIGNSNIMLGGFVDDEMKFVVRIATVAKETEFEYAGKIVSVMSLYGVKREDISGAIIASVVPPLNTVMKKAVKLVFGVDAIMVGPGVKSGLNIHCDTPSSVGADIICACVAAERIYKGPALIIDMGTATKMMVIDEKGAFIGVSIIPGVLMGLNALSENTAQLPKISLEAPKNVVAKNTADCMRSGVVFGNASMIDGMIDRISSELGTELPVYATGGLASDIIPFCKHGITIDQHLVMKGLNIIYHKNVNN